jgi:hypothetical protein
VEGSTSQHFRVLSPIVFNGKLHSRCIPAAFISSKNLRRLLEVGQNIRPTILFVGG